MPKPVLLNSSGLQPNESTAARWPRNPVAAAICRSAISSPTHGLGSRPPQRAQNRCSSGAPVNFGCPYFPRRTAGDYGFRQMGRTTVTPWSFRKPACRRMRRSLTRAFRFVCLGPHTHRNAPAEARARFSEDPANHFYRIEITTAQPGTTGRLDTTRRTFSIYQPVRIPSTARWQRRGNFRQARAANSVMNAGCPRFASFFWTFWTLTWAEEGSGWPTDEGDEMRGFVKPPQTTWHEQNRYPTRRRAQ